MSTHTKPLQEHEEAEIEGWIKSKVGQIPKCPCCSKNIWQVHSHLIYHPQSIIAGDKNKIPLVAFVCKNCAHFMFFGAVAMNLQRFRK